MPRAFRGEFEDAAGYGWTLAQPSFDWPTLIANKDKEIARLEAAYTRDAAEGRRRDRQEPRHACRRPHGATGERRARARRPHFDLDRRRAQLRRPNPRHRARHLLQRGVSSAGIAAPRAHPGRRLYRGRVCRHFRRPRLAGDARLSRRKYPARLRRRRAPASAHGHGEARHQGHHRLQGRGDRARRRASVGASDRRQSHSRRLRDVRRRARCRTSASSACKRPASRSARTAASPSTNIRAPTSPAFMPSAT